MTAQKNLSQHDYSRWIQALQNLPTAPSDLMAWIETDLRNFFHFEKLFVAYGELTAGQIKATHWLAVGYTHDYLQSQAGALEIETRGSLRWWFANRQPFYIDPDQPPDFATAYEIDEIKTQGLKNIAAHGILNVRANAGTYFSFAGVSSPLGDWHLDALRILTPVLNDLYLAYLAAHSQSVSSNLANLTPRQKDIVRHLSVSSDDKTLAKNLGLSEKTVRNQLTEIYARLGIKKRTQLLQMLK
jgi:DNA-binding CsgD family transcriptional regulator